MHTRNSLAGNTNNSGASPSGAASSPSIHHHSGQKAPNATSFSASDPQPQSQPSLHSQSSISSSPSTSQQATTQIRDKVKEQLILHFHSNQRVFSSSDYLQIDFDSPQRAKEVMAMINRIRLLLTREILSQNNLL